MFCRKMKRIAELALDVVAEDICEGIKFDIKQGLKVNVTLSEKEVRQLALNVVGNSVTNYFEDKELHG